METGQTNSPSGTPAHRVRRNLTIGLLIAALLFAILAGVILATQPRGDAASYRAGAPVAITILHTNDTWGYLLPCG